MYQFLNCFPLGPTRIIKRIKLMKRRARRPVSKSNLSRSELSLFEKKYDGDRIDTNESKEVKLMSYSNLDVTIIKETGLKDENGKVFEMKEEVTRLNSVVLEKIMEECEADGKGKMIDDQVSAKSVTAEEEEIANQILHELHVNSFTPQPTSTTSLSSNQSCTLAAKHVDRNVEEVTKSNRTDCSPNEFTNTNHFDSTNMDTEAAPVHNELTNEQLTKLIDIQPDTVNVDEVDSLIPNPPTTVNDKLTQSNDSLTNKESIATKPTNQQLIIEPTPFEDTKRKTNKKLIQDTDLRTNAILNGVETWIELNKGSNCALGIDLIDRLINDRKLFIIHEIVEKGIAETDQRLMVGDVILQVNEMPLKEMSCEEALEHLNCTSGSVKLLVYRELICINDQHQSSNESLDKSSKRSLKLNYSTQSTMQENERDENVEQKVINGRLYEIIKVDLQKKTNKGLGICIVNDDRSPGPYISEILPNSIAHLEGRLKKGDHIVNVNGEDVSNRPINTTLAMLKCLQGLVTLKVARLLPGQIVLTDEFNRSQHQRVEPTQISFQVIVLNPKKKNVIFIKRKPVNDRINQLIVPKDTDSVGSFTLFNETVSNEWDTSSAVECTENSAIGKNWIKIDKTKKLFEGDWTENLNQQLANFDCPTIDCLVEENRILEIDGHPFTESTSEKLINKLKRSTSTVQMIVLN